MTTVVTILLAAGSAGRAWTADCQLVFVGICGICVFVFVYLYLCICICVFVCLCICICVGSQSLAAGAAGRACGCRLPAAAAGVSWLPSAARLCVAVFFLNS